MTAPELAAYFDLAYPARSSVAGKLFSRHGEDERMRVVREWLPSTRGARILDAGCGDGVFLRSILAGRPAVIVCEDISARAVWAATRELAGQADVLNCAVRDAIQESSGGFDAVLAIGMLDYQKDWGAALAKLVRRSNALVIATIPRREHCRNWIRHAWFLLHNIAFCSAQRDHVRRIARAIDGPFELQRTRYDWFLRIDRNGHSS